ncbi:MBL fold metallo-hydrolase [Phaeovulum sp. NW3]|uniref:MBL fold metallo-hydrolase RNA specificity domain-containing protein n=1 Tax=Phaeovulum sp. NW3 TaxID=2934933 RepID=UPI002021CFA8|nr:MBL fold metallo-hydrolase [Phaeovulum sp. NW3]MCL7466546.1 MBL fold metallo-hydrolase [Phaeovulum sp. NW3]
MKLTVLGAAREVTGSSYLIETATARFLVDCGMVQGGASAATRNRQPFAFDPRSLDFVLLTHAHIDHSGMLPKLTKAGFTGPVLTTPATADLLEVMLRDSAHIQEMDAARAARGGRDKRRAAPEPVTPIYTVRDAEACLRQVRGHSYQESIAPHPDVVCIFRDAGHILGSAIIEIWIAEAAETVKLVFSGDLGQPGRAILHDPATIAEADILVMESTYGDRAHRDQAATLDEMVTVITETRKRGGNVIMPAFAVGRTQEILYHLHCLSRQGRLRDLSIFVDSPMADRATQITKNHLALFDEEARNLVDWHEAASDRPRLRFTASTEESRALNQIEAGAIIISASGMCDAGRIRHHLRHNLPRPESAILITGFQAQGTLGRRLVDGARRVRIFGDDIPVRASVHTLNGFSAHADQPALLDWAGRFRRVPSKVIVTHGEAQVAEGFAGRLREDFGWPTIVPERGAALDWPAPRHKGAGP